MSYQPLVKERLAKECEVYVPDENCQFSLYALSSLERWLESFPKPDIVHFNVGLHDVGHNPNRVPNQIPLDMYIGNLNFILRRLNQTGARILWATTTPVHPKQPFSDMEWAWRNEEIDSYNEKATVLMKQNNIYVNDLHGLVLSRLDTYLSEDHVHLSAEGKKSCAAAVCEAINKFA